MEQKTFQVINTANCKYVYLTDEQKLVSMELMETVYDLESGEASQQFKLGGDEHLTQLSLNSQFYVSEGSFKLGAPLTGNQAIDTIALVNIMEMLFKSRYVKEDEIGPFLWVYENGEATKWRLEERTKKVFIDYNDLGNCRIDTTLPKVYYESAEEVYQYNDYIVQDRDGKQVVREGVYRRLFLTDEQNVLLDQLQEKIKECKNAGIALEFNLATYELTAFNANNIKRYDYDPFIDEEREENYYLDLSRAGRAISGIGDCNTEDDCLRFVIEKTKAVE